jgi:hypothetical protein
MTEPERRAPLPTKKRPRQGKPKRSWTDRASRLFWTLFLQRRRRKRQSSE